MRGQINCSSPMDSIQLGAKSSRGDTFLKARPAEIMVITPHPDDAEFGVAGSVARWVKEGKDVVYVVCTNGDKGTGDTDVNPAQLVKVREKEQLAAANVLGVREVTFLRHPDQGLEDTPDPGILLANEF